MDRHQINDVQKKNKESNFSGTHFVQMFQPRSKYSSVFVNDVDFVVHKTRRNKNKDNYNITGQQLHNAPLCLALKFLRSTHTVYLCVLYGSEDEERLFPYTAFTDWFL